MDEHLKGFVRGIVREVIAELVPHLAGACEYVTKANVERIYSRKWRSIDEAAQRLEVERLRIAGGPAYRRADLDAAFAKTAKKRPEKTDDYARAVDAAGGAET